MPSNSRHAEIDVIIVNVQGLHARPVMRFVDTAARFGSRIRVRKAQLDVDGKSAMEMMLLEARKGTVLRLVADGDDAGAALAALQTLVEAGFGEDRGDVLA